MRKYIIAFSLVWLSGAASGLHETITYHYQSFRGWFPSADPQYWNPAESWTAKYRNGDPAQGARFFGSTTFGVAFTDAKHALDAVRRNALMLGLFIFGYYYRELKYRHHFLLVAIAAASIWLVQSLGFYLVYSLLF